MSNDQLLPGYNIQLGICDEYAVYDIKQYASDMDCFIPLVEKFKNIHGFHHKYPVADTGYGSFNNYLYYEEHGMEKYMKFTIFEKESKDEKYRNNPYRAVNFPINKNGKPVCPNGKEFHYLYTKPANSNKKQPFLLYIEMTVFLFSTVFIFRFPFANGQQPFIYDYFCSMKEWCFNRLDKRCGFFAAYIFISINRAEIFITVKRFSRNSAKIVIVIL